MSQRSAERLTCAGTERIDKPTTNQTREDTADSSDGDGGRRLAQRHTTDEDDSFDTLTKHGDQREEEERPASGLDVAHLTRLHIRAVCASDALLLESSHELDAPFDALALEAQHGDTHDEDDDRGDEREDTLPEFLRLRP